MKVRVHARSPRRQDFVLGFEHGPRLVSQISFTSSYAEVHYRIEYIAYREKLDLDKAAERVETQAKLFAEDPDLYTRYRAANTMRVGKVSVTD